MPSDSIAGFLDRAQASRVLFPEQVEQLIRQPDIPQSDLASLCIYLLSRGVLTKFQSDALRESRGHELSFAGYPILDKLGPCRGGIAYQALHPSLRTPLIIRRLETAAFAPTDDVNVVVQRARAYGLISHANILPLLDAGAYQGHPYAVLDQPPDTADLASMLKEVGGAMPGFLAAEYGWAIASALRAIHERGGWHGEVRPGLLFIGPIMAKSYPDGSVRRRPAPNASVKLTETGLIPISLPAVVKMPSVDVLAYLPPERVDSNIFDARGDIYGLGATLYLLLAGRPPFSGASSEELLQKIRTTEPIALASLRPDIPEELATFVMKMMMKRPDMRPQTTYEVCQTLAQFCRPGTLPAEPQPAAIPQAIAVTPTPAPIPVPFAVSVPQPVPVAVPAGPPEPDGWGVNPNAFADAQAASVADKTQRRRRQMTDKDKARSKMWIAIGLCLHLTAVCLALGYAAYYWGWFDSKPTTPQKTEPTKKR